MKKLLLVLLCLPFIGIGQNLYPEKVIALEFSEDRAKKFNTQQAWDECNKLPAVQSISDFTSEEQKTNQLCNEMKDEIWHTDAVSWGNGWYDCVIEPIKVSASSFLESQGNNKYDAINAHDFNYKNAWVEGVAGYGIGEYLVYKFHKSTPQINTIIIVNGYVKSNSAWQKNSRVKKLKVYVNNKEFVYLNLQDNISEQHFYIPEIGNFDNHFAIKFKIMEVYKGTKYDDVVISEIYFDGLCH